ncbi:uncharacterized protein ARMOST_13845 [Armillaria ostoyae]|uniref:CCHC-type domain-containing protein n=1 Tax=Armillaria ostoyae TaxID=47428 RepID=A0A284RNX6_ARMOS|nr:uncharacterized protein ARMOST_13845 [Armillaria ostoyae]
MTTSLAPKKTVTGTIYGGQGQPMDIDAVKSGNCFCCGEKGHISKNCLLQSWNKGKQEIRALTTEPSMGSKIEEVKDGAGNHSGKTYYMLVDNALVSHMLHSILFAESVSKQPCKESHNRYAVLAFSSASDDEAHDETESLPSAPNNGTNHLTSSSLQVKVPGNKPPTIVVPAIMASSARPGRAGQQGASSPPDQAAPRVENTAARKPIIINLPQNLSDKSQVQTGQETPKVAMIEVPDEEDDTSFRLHQVKVAATDADACGDVLGNGEWQKTSGRK